MCLYPEKTTTVTPISEDPNSQSCGGGIIFGVSDQGINYSPFARLYWVNPNTQEENIDWHVEADFTLNMDLNGGHVNNVSRYHYHNIPTNYFANDLQIDGTAHSPLLSYATDGFPIYYKYLYTNGNDMNSGISAFQSGYQLKLGNRPGNGVEAPDGAYDGNYVEDYEYINNLSELDECGGRYGKTPEYPNGTYYYVLTDNWPYIPRCFKGKNVDNSFKIGPNCPASTAVQDCSTIVLSIDDLIHTNITFNVYPNPVTTHITLKFSSGFNTYKISDIRIYSATATLVYSSKTFQKEINLENLKPGVYFIQIDINGDQLTKKIIVE